MGQRREVAGRPHAPLFGHDRVDAGAQELQQAVHEQRPAATVAEGERIGAEQEHRPNDLAWEWLADPGSVAHQEVLLEAPGLLRLDEGRGQVAESGRHAVDDGARR